MANDTSPAPVPQRTRGRRPRARATPQSPRTNGTFHALAHPIRRRVVERLAVGPATVGETTRGFGVSKPTMSRHLHVLEQAGVISRQVQGRTHTLRLEESVLGEAEAWLEEQRMRWLRLFDAVENYLEEGIKGE